MPTPLWSVMIPTFHCARFLRQTLESVLSQDTRPDVMQIEVIDDCSTQDDPESVVRAAAGERVHFFLQPKNVGHTRNFETCLQRARGHLVHLLHGDDAVRHGFYRKTAQLFGENVQFGAAFCRHVIMDGDGGCTSRRCSGLRAGRCQTCSNVWPLSSASTLRRQSRGERSMKPSIRRVFSFLVLWLRIMGSRLKRWMKSKLDTPVHR
jgi:glycosyltransferase involved in cell wall biosynthesis